MTPHPAPARSLRWLRVLAPLSLALGLSAGCSKADMTAYPEEAMFNQGAELPPAPMIDVTEVETAANADGAYDFTGDLADESALSAERSLMAMGQTHRAFDTNFAPPARDAKGKKNDAAKQKDKQEDGSEATSGEAEGKDDQKPGHGRQIIYTAGLQVSVFDLENGMALVEAIPDQYGGWIAMRTPNQVVLRLPAPVLKPVMAQVAELGVVEARSLNASDVTAEYVDLESRIKVLRETQTQLLELLGEAKTVEEALHVRNALDNVTMELEVALGRMRQLDDQIAFSTLTVTLVERGPQDRLPTHNDPFSWVDRLGVEATEWR